MTTDRPSVWIQDLTWEEVDSYLKHERIVIVPVGSTEQHGPAGVLGVDSYVAMTLAEDVAERVRLGSRSVRSDAAEDQRVEDDDVGHRHEGDEPAAQLTTDGGAALGHVEETFEHAHTVDRPDDGRRLETWSSHRRSRPG